MESLIQHPLLLRNIAALNYVEPTEIQRKAIPLIRQGRDVLGIAQTGTGKTASFALPLVERLLGSSVSSTPSILVLVPTRELCVQTHQSIQEFSSDTPVRSIAIYGGVKQEYQARDIRQGVNFIVATPGRLHDLLTKKLLTLEGIEVLVLDEADRMLDQGFLPDFKKIREYLPKDMQTLLYSATIPEGILKLAQSILRDPVEIAVTENSSVSAAISQNVIHCLPTEKLHTLRALILEEASGSLLIFTNTKTAADNVAQYLTKNHIESRSLHADKKQAEREKILRQFSEGRLNVLVATDVMARGIDVETIDVVINFDLPAEPEAYVHRIGRTGRAGRKGSAFSLCTNEDLKTVAAIELLTGVTITKLY